MKKTEIFILILGFSFAVIFTGLFIYSYFHYSSIRLIEKFPLCGGKPELNPNYMDEKHQTIRYLLYCIFGVVVSLSAVFYAYHRYLKQLTKTPSGNPAPPSS